MHELGSTRCAICPSRPLEHMHKLSLRYHLQKHTGGLSRIIERGTHAIEGVVRHTILHAVPTFLQFIFMAAVIGLSVRLCLCAGCCGDDCTLCCLHHSGSPLGASIFGGRMNESDNEANSKAVDSLLNYETSEIFRQMRRWKVAAMTNRWRCIRKQPSAHGCHWPGSISVRR